MQTSWSGGRQLRPLIIASPMSAPSAKFLARSRCCLLTRCDYATWLAPAGVVGTLILDCRESRGGGGTGVVGAGGRWWGTSHAHLPVVLTLAIFRVFRRRCLRRPTEVLWGDTVGEADFGRRTSPRPRRNNNAPRKAIRLRRNAGRRRRGWIRMQGADILCGAGQIT